MTSPVVSTQQAQQTEQSQQSQQSQHIDRRIAKERLTPSQRFGEVVSLIISALIIGYFLHLWTIDAGFFTSAFQPPEQFWFFAPMVLATAAPTVRLLVGQRNPARPFEIVTDVLMVIGAIWLLRVFPFDFSHLGDALPGNLPALLNWVPNWLGKVGLALQLVGGAIALIVTTVQFLRAGLRC
jgi:hypothetical protein